MNKKLTFGALAAIASLSLYSCQQPAAPAATAEAATPTVTNESLLQIVEDLPTTQAFLKDPIRRLSLHGQVRTGSWILLQFPRLKYRNLPYLKAGSR